ncbi:MAG: hypothetical protein CL793_06535 [Chloroflexi bacterium]|nr:hypothetical protein [Chloroflexota bacterium]
MKCCICKKEITPEPNGWDGGHNPDPYPHEDGEACCTRCNFSVVLPLRMTQIKSENVSRIADVLKDK